MSEEIAQAQVAACKSILGVCAHSLRALANAGLLDPKIMDEIEHDFMLPFQGQKGEAAERIRAILDATAAPMFAALRLRAQTTWKG